MIKIDNYDYFIFDCDGVILESNELKSIAFAKSLNGEPKSLIRDFVKYHKNNGGISRFEKFKYYYEKIKKDNNPEVKIDKALYNFSNIVSKELLVCNYVPGVLEFIYRLFNSNKRLFIVSGSEQKELIKVFNYRGIDHYFEKIYGSPTNKIENTKKVISTFNISDKGVFFGDSKSDYRAAKIFDINFVFVKRFSEWRNGNKRNISEENLVIDDFNNLNQ